MDGNLNFPIGQKMPERLHAITLLLIVQELLDSIAHCAILHLHREFSLTKESASKTFQLFPFLIPIVFIK